tara:strand:- start:254 stop:529 length:276 start_codon:yes stop_codon:yes gene_type:complete
VVAKVLDFALDGAADSGASLLLAGYAQAFGQPGDFGFVARRFFTRAALETRLGLCNQCLGLSVARDMSLANLLVYLKLASEPGFSFLGIED